MHITLALETGALCVILGRISYAWRRRTRNLAGSHAPCQPLRLLLLQFFQHLFDGNDIENVFSGGGEDGEYSKCAIFLILLEAATEAIYLSADIASR